MVNTVEEAFGLIKELAKDEGHPDQVARLYAASLKVSLRVGQELERLRKEERVEEEDES